MNIENIKSGSDVTFHLQIGDKVIIINGKFVKYDGNKVEVLTSEGGTAEFLSTTIVLCVIKDKPTVVVPEPPVPVVVPEPPVLVALKARYEATFQFSNLDLYTPDFIIPSSELDNRFYQTRQEINSYWSSAKIHYNNYLSSKEKDLDKLKKVRVALEELTKRHSYFYIGHYNLACVNFILKNIPITLEEFSKAAAKPLKVNIIEEEKAPVIKSLHNLAYIHLFNEDNIGALRSLESLFGYITPSQDNPAWLKYVHLAATYRFVKPFLKLCEKESLWQQPADFKLLMEAILYILYCHGGTSQAVQVLNYFKDDTLPSNGIACKVLETLSPLNINPVVSYYQLESEREASLVIQLEKEKKHEQFLNYKDIAEEQALKRQWKSALAQIRLALKLEPNNEIARHLEGEYLNKSNNSTRVQCYVPKNQVFQRSTPPPNTITTPKNNNYSPLDTPLPPETSPDSVDNPSHVDNAYNKAKDAHIIDKDYEKAEKLYLSAIFQRDHRMNSAILDLASLYAQQKNFKKAVKFLEDNRNKVQDQSRVDRSLINYYPLIEKYDEAIALIESQYVQAKDNVLKQIQWRTQIAYVQLKAKNYTAAYQIFEEVLSRKPDDLLVQRNQAFCLINMERYDEARDILANILKISPDPKAQELLDSIDAREFEKIKEYFDINRFDLSERLSEFARFFLDRVKIIGGVSESRFEEEKGRKRYIANDADANFDTDRVRRGISIADGARIPNDQADYRLLLAKIILDKNLNSDDAYQYIWRSFQYRGDAADSENKPLISSEWYRQALVMYQYTAREQTSSDFRYLIIRYLRFNLSVLLGPFERENLEEFILRVLSQSNADTSIRFFNAVINLALYSKYARDYLLNIFVSSPQLTTYMLQYLNYESIAKSSEIIYDPQYLEKLWEKLQEKKSAEVLEVTRELSLLRQVDLATASLRQTLDRLSKLKQKPYFYSQTESENRQRLDQMRQIYEHCLKFFETTSGDFMERDDICRRAKAECDELLKLIEMYPTLLSVESLYPIVKELERKIMELRSNLNEHSKPVLRLELGSKIYPANDKIEVQVVVSNRSGCSPAESGEVFVKNDSNLYTAQEENIPFNTSLLGGESRTVLIELHLTDQARQEKAFSLNLKLSYLPYGSREKENVIETIHTLPIQLGSVNTFEPVAQNPYHAGEKEDRPDMFKGRDELVERIEKAVSQETSGEGGKSIAVYGQKRAGKTSLLGFVKRKLEQNPRVLTLDLGNIANFISEKNPLEEDFGWEIITCLKREIGKEEKRLGISLKLNLPDRLTYNGDSNKKSLLKTCLEDFRELTRKNPKWEAIKLILLIDEFSYLYQRNMVNRAKLKPFLTFWKALLQSGLFNVVMAGHDGMTAFMQEYGNEFAIADIIQINYLEERYARELIEKPVLLSNGESRYASEAIRRIINLTACNPYYLQLLCNKIVEVINIDSIIRVTDAHVDKMLSNYLDELIITPKFDNLTDSGDNLSLFGNYFSYISGFDEIEKSINNEIEKVLEEIAVRSSVGFCPRSDINCSTTISIDLILKDLMRRSVIEQQGHSYIIKVGLFKQYLTRRKGN